MFMDVFAALIKCIWPAKVYFTAINVSPSSKLNKDQKKGLRRKLSVFFSKLGEDQNKGLCHNLGLYSAEIWNLFVLADSFSSDHPALKYQWGDP